MRDEIEPMVPRMPRTADSAPPSRTDGGQTIRPVAAVDAPLVPDIR